MGGFGSGRRGGYGTTERGLTLDMTRCMKLRQFRPGQHVQGEITWTMSNSGRRVASIGYQVNMLNPEDAWVRLTYSTNRRGEAVDLDYRIKLTTTLPHFGGLRWWFICPASGRRVRCLHLVGGYDRFVCRQFLGLGYQVQRESWDNRCLRAAQTADAKLGGKGNLSLPNPPKPKWMRWPTYHRLCLERENAILRSLDAACAALGMQHLVDRIAPPPLDPDKEN